MADKPTPHIAAHPTPMTYFKVAMVLAFVTSVEVAVFYVDALKPAFLLIFLVLSLFKFSLVVMFYMHLKFDHRLFSGVFVGGLVLAVAVGVTLLALFQVMSAVANPSEGRALFLHPPNNALTATCSSCHAIEGISSSTIGPDLTNIGNDAGARDPGTTAEKYLTDYLSAQHLSDYPGTEGLTDQQVNKLVEFLLAQAVSASPPISRIVPIVVPTVTPPLVAKPTDTPPPKPEKSPTPTTPTPEVTREPLFELGKSIYLISPPNVGAQPLWCSTCHQIEGVTQGLIGPDLTHVGTDAANRVPGMSAEDYIRESIVDPEARLTAGVDRGNTPGLMIKSITEGLTDEQVDALVAFLLAQE